MKDYRQGDVLLKQIDKLPQGLEKVEPEGDRIILMHGERTGHAHAFYKESPELDLGVHMFRDPVTGERFIEILGGGAALKHEEHLTVNLTGGTVYRLPVQVEDDSEFVQQVED